MSAIGTVSARIGIVEDHHRYREALLASIDAMAGVTVAWAADHSDDALARMVDDAVDLAVVDLSIPGVDGIELIGLFRESWPETACLVVSGHTESSYVRRSFDAGAIGYVVKGRPSDLRDGIAAGLRNDRYLSPALGDVSSHHATSPTDTSPTE